ncbi:MAG: HIT domain-containing protein [Bacteroidota bacterium]|nr:HIT domain-containing protein [Bacteroidota bacterium]
MASIFTKIVNKEIPCYKVAENDEFLAFLDISPLVKGHTIVIPKKEIDYIFDIEDDMYQRYLLFAKKVAKSIEKSIKCIKIGVAVIGLEVPHAHIHLVPMNQMDDINFGKKKLKLTDDEMNEISSNILNSYNLLYNS